MGVVGVVGGWKVLYMIVRGWFLGEIWFFSVVWLFFRGWVFFVFVGCFKEEILF